MGNKRIDFEAGDDNMTLTSGDGTKAITFDQVFNAAPVVVACLSEDPGAGKRGLLWVHTITTTGFTAELDSDSASSDIDFTWIAMEHRSSERAGL